jgi:hypothetical protein
MPGDPLDSSVEFALEHMTQEGVREMHLNGDQKLLAQNVLGEKLRQAYQEGVGQKAASGVHWLAVGLLVLGVILAGGVFGAIFKYGPAVYAASRQGLGIQAGAPDLYQQILGPNFTTAPATHQMDQDVKNLIPTGGSVSDIIPFQNIALIEIDNGDGKTYTEVLFQYNFGASRWDMVGHVCEPMPYAPPTACQGK